MAEGATPTDDTIVLSVHGAAGVLDLVVPEQATPVDVAREYSRQTGQPGLPLMQTPLGALLAAGTSLADSGVRSGDVLVATRGVHHGSSAASSDQARVDHESPVVATLAAALSVLLAALASWYAVGLGEATLRTVVVGVLLGAALVVVVPWGPHLGQRVAAAPAFAAAAAFAALHEPGAEFLPAVIGAAALAAAVVAAMARAMAPHPDEVITVWIAGGLVVLAACSVGALFGWAPQVSWSLLLFLAMMASRFAPSLAIDVPDEALLDLDRLAVTAWSARDRGTKGRRGRIVVAGNAVATLVQSASRTVTAAAAGVLLVVSFTAPLLLAAADIDLDRIGARTLVFFVGASLLLAARSYRHAAARALLRCAGLVAWAALALHLVAWTGATYAVWFFAAVMALGVISLIAAVATGRGWRSVWWSRRAEVAETLAGSFALASVVVAAGVFRSLWEMTS